MGNFNKKIWILAAVLSLITTFLLYSYVSGLQKPKEEKMGKVYVASQNIPARSIVVKEMIKEDEIPVEYIHPLAITQVEQIIGKTTQENIVEGEQIISTRLAEESTSKLSFKIPEGKRAVTINANEITLVGNLIYPSDFVDILVTLETAKVEENGKVTQYPQSTKIILQNIQVLAIGHNMYNHNPSGEIAKSVTLAVTPQQSEQLVLAEDMGHLRLVLRPALDDKPADTSGAIRQDISTNRGAVIN